jgi:hypothetical protein
MVVLGVHDELFLVRRNPNTTVLTPYSKISGLDFGLGYAHLFLPIFDEK